MSKATRASSTCTKRTGSMPHLVSCNTVACFTLMGFCSNLCLESALLTTRAPAVFSNDFKHFYCRYNDPPCVKILKLEILTTIATASRYSRTCMNRTSPCRSVASSCVSPRRRIPFPRHSLSLRSSLAAVTRSVAEIIEELAEYVTDPDNSVARGAVSSIGKMGVNISECANAVSHARLECSFVLHPAQAHLLLPPPVPAPVPVPVPAPCCYHHRSVPVMSGGDPADEVSRD